MSLLRYPEYKDSGVAWLGEIPVHWTEVALSRVLAAPVTDGPHTTPTFIDEGIPFLSVDGIQDGELVFEGCRYISHEDHIEFSRKACPRKGDILMGKAASIGKIARVKMDTVFDIWSPLALIRSDEDTCGAVFLEYALKSKESQAQIETKANSNTQLNIGMKDIPKLRICLPSINEQQAIATFLDRETDKIDALIAEQQRLVELLAEKRQAVISHAVTKGLNPNAPMKDSGIEWLGEVPEHWTIRRLVQLTAKIGDGLHGTPQYVDGSEYFFINGNNLINGCISLNETTKCVSREEFETHQVELNEHTLLMSINGTIGNLAFYQGESVILGKSAAYINCLSILSKKLLFYILKSNFIKTFYELEVTGTTIFNLSLETIRNTWIPLPPLDEQCSIVDFLNQEIASLDALTTEANRATALLQERRSALISAAVTGKIDVRKAPLAEAA
jgi:type I restriction enzyme S subunit